MPLATGAVSELNSRKCERSQSPDSLIPIVESTVGSEAALGATAIEHPRERSQTRIRRPTTARSAVPPGAKVVNDRGKVALRYQTVT